ncbi:aspartate/glutamate racemase family protein [Halioxenophilus aromaticivorans]|uniref:Amino acid racemase n=1 Tax=Halioxenophilus aromaticivorans TaxID=1306992 RepID=A0AAV3TYH8_9ALTE
MKKLGIIGGIGWPSTLDYYRVVCEASHQYHRRQGHPEPLPTPEIAIESLNMSVTVNSRGDKTPGSWQAWDEYFKQALQRLEASGAQRVVIASVTPHNRLAQLQKMTRLPIVSVFASVGKYCNEQGVSNLLLLGTLPTMQSAVFSRQLASFGVNVSVPQPGHHQKAVTALIDQLYRGETAGAADQLCDLVQRVVPAQQLGETHVLLGCTELSTAFAQAKKASRFSQSGIEFVNLAHIHASDAFTHCVYRE